MLLPNIASMYKWVNNFFLGGPNGSQDFLQLVRQSDKTVLGWIDETGTPRGSLANPPASLAGPGFINITGGNNAVYAGAYDINGVPGFTSGSGNIGGFMFFLPTEVTTNKIGFGVSAVDFDDQYDIGIYGPYTGVETELPLVCHTGPQSTGSLNLTQTAADSFNRANENPLSDGGNWVTCTLGHIEVENDAASPVSNSGNAAEFYTGASFSANQYASVKLSFQGTDSFVGILLRSQATSSFGDATGAYVVTFGIGDGAEGGTVSVSTSLSGGNFGGQSGFTFNDGDILAAAVVGSTIYILQNGSLLEAFPDINSTYSSGSIGLYFNGNNAGAAVVDFTAGSAALVAGTLTADTTAEIPWVDAPVSIPAGYYFLMFTTATDLEETGGTFQSHGISSGSSGANLLNAAFIPTVSTGSTASTLPSTIALSVALVFPPPDTPLQMQFALF